MSNFFSASLPVLGFSLVFGLVALGISEYVAYRNRQQQQEERRQQRGQRSESRAKRRPPPQPSDDCIICKDTLAAPVEILPCSHLYHRQCIREWFKLRMICPYCNTSIAEVDKDEYRQRLGLTPNPF